METAFSLFKMCSTYWRTVAFIHKHGIHMTLLNLKLTMLLIAISVLSLIGATIVAAANEDIDTGLVENGDFFDGLDSWISTGTTPAIIDAETQSAYIGDGVLEQSITIEDEGLYQFTFTCQEGTQPSTEPKLIYIIYDSQTGSGTDLTPTSCAENNTFTHRLALLAGEHELIFIAKDVWLDDISLTPINDYTDIDTGLIQNGDFIGLAGWEIPTAGFDEHESYLSTDGASEVGALRDLAVQSNIDIATDGIYALSMFCGLPEGSEPEETNTAIVFFTKSSDANFGTSKQIPCENQNVVVRLALSAGLYDLTLLLTSASRPSEHWLDDVSLFQEAEFNDINTGLIPNGDFIGDAGWDFLGWGSEENARYYDPLVGASEIGSALLTNELLMAVSPIDVGDTPSGIYELAAYCEVLFDAELEEISLDFALTSESESHDISIPCENGVVTRTVTMASGQYTFTITNATTAELLIDDVSLFLIESLAPEGDTDCDDDTDSIDALFILQFDVGLRTDIEGCPLNDSSNQINAAAGDVNMDGQTNSVDALLILQCNVNLYNSFCPAP